MKLTKCMTPKGFNKSDEIISGQIIDTSPFYYDGQTRFLISTGNGSELVCLWLSTAEIAAAVTGRVVDAALENQDKAA